MMGRVALFVGCAIVSALLAAGVSPSSAGEPLLVRQHPVRVRWGEVAIAETSRVRLKVRKEEQEFPYAVSLVFSGRERIDDLDALLGGKPQAQSKLTPAGTFYIAGRMGGGRTAWDRLVKHLQTAASQISPAGYSHFLDSAAWLSAEPLEEVGDYTLVFCVSRPGAEDRAGEASLKHEGDPPVRSSGTSTWDPTKQAAPICGALREALRFLPPSEVITTNFTVDESLEETFDVRSVDRLRQPPVALPAGASLEHAAPPEGASGQSSVSTRDGVAHSEFYEIAEKATAEERAKSYVLVTEVRSGSRLPRGLTEGRSLLLRWSARLRATRLGQEPRIVSEENRDLLMGVFCTTADSAPALDALTTAVVRDLSERDGLLTAQIMRASVASKSRTLGVENAFVVYCSPGPAGAPTADYCLSSACAPIENPKEICAEIAGALGE